MKNTPSLLRSGLLSLALLIGLGFTGLEAAVTLTVTPSAVSNTYAGTITLQINGLISGETVVVQEFLDVNTNGVIDAADWLVQQVKLADGVASLIGGATNINVPGDSTPTNSAITAQMNFVTAGSGVPIAGRYLYKLSSPSDRFTPVTSLFSVTNLPYSQSIAGNVVCNGTNVPNTLVMAFDGLPMRSNPIGGAIGNNAGGYTIPLPPGTYSLIAFKSNYVINAATAPTLTLGSGGTPTTNLSLLPTTCSISGKVVNAGNTNRGLPGLWVFLQSTSSLMGFGITDTNGYFSAQVTASEWELKFDSMQLPALGYARFQDKPQVNTTTGSVSAMMFTLPKGTALFYGSVKDAQNHPLTGVRLYPNDDSNQYEGEGVTDQNGNYAVAVVAGTWQIQPDNSSSPAYANYIFPRVRGVPLSDGQAVREDFVGVVVTNQISGYLKDSGNNPISGVWVWAQATINGADYETGTDTDGTGHYAFNVCNGMWTVGVSYGGGGDSLGSQYLCPDNQTVNIANNNGTASFTALLPSSGITGYVRDTSNNPIPNVGVYARVSSNGPYDAYVTTDGNGHYAFSVANGNWNVGINCCGNNSLNPLGFVCVGDQSTSVNNSTNVVNFSVARAPYQITGHLRDAGNNPIPNVNVWGNNGSDNACATTDGGGFYTLYVTNGDWNINLDCGTLGSLGYLCPGGQFVSVSGANAVADFSTIQTPYQISGSVKNNSNQPFTNLNVYAYATIGTNYYQSGAWTDGSGNYFLPVANGQWNVGVDCGGLGSGYQCPNEVTINIAGGSVVTNFIIQPCGQLQIMTTSLPNGQVGSYYDFYLQASSCAPNFIWGLASGSTPPGLNGDPSTGEIYGMPETNGTFLFAVQVTDGNNVTATQSLSLTISPAPGDVQSYSVMKLEAFRQLDASSLVLDTNHGPFNAYLAIIQSAVDTVPVASVYLPSGGVRGFPPGSSAINPQIHESFATQAALDAVYTNGNYTFNMATRNNGFQFPVLTLTAAAYPGAQRVSNFMAAQAINPANPFTVQWINPPDATINDTIWAFILDSGGNMIISTPFPPTNHSTCLRGTDTSVVLPAGTFQPGGSYTGVLCFFRVTSVNTTAYPNAAGVTVMAVQTVFSMAALSSLPVLSQPARISATQFGFLLSGSSGTNYTVLTSTNAALPLSNWSTLLTTNLQGNSAFIQDNQATSQRRFYRVKVGP